MKIKAANSRVLGISDCYKEGIIQKEQSMHTCTLLASFACFSLSIFSGVMKWLESTVSTP